jgi:hypothetical protein
MLDMAVVVDPKHASKCAALGNNILYQQPWRSFSFYKYNHSNLLTAKKSQAFP